MHSVSSFPDPVLMHLSARIISEALKKLRELASSFAILCREHPRLAGYSGRVSLRLPRYSKSSVAWGEDRVKSKYLVCGHCSVVRPRVLFAF